MNTYKIVCYRPTSVSAAVSLMKSGTEIPEEYIDTIFRVFEKSFASSKDAEIYAEGVAEGVEASGIAAGSVQWRWGFVPVPNVGIPEIKKSIKLVPSPEEKRYRVVHRKDLDIVEIYSPGVVIPEGMDVADIRTKAFSEREIVVYAKGYAEGLEAASQTKIEVRWASPKAVRRDDENDSRSIQAPFKWENYNGRIQ